MKPAELLYPLKAEMRPPKLKPSIIWLQLEFLSIEILNIIGDTEMP